MPSPSQSITTVSGRRCTRSRARTATTSTLATEEPSVTTSSEINSSTTVEQTPQTQTSATEPPPPPSLSLLPSSTVSVEQPAAAPTTEASTGASTETSTEASTGASTETSTGASTEASTGASTEAPTETSAEATTEASTESTTEAAVTSVTGTIGTVSISSAQSTPLASLAPSGPAEELSTPAAVPSPVAIVNSSLPTNPASTSSDTLVTAVPTLSSVAPSIVPSPFTAPAASVALSSVDIVPEQPSQTHVEPPPLSTDTPAGEQPQRTTSAVASLISGGSAGIIAPDQGSGGGGAFILPDTRNANIGSIVGGIIGGVAGLVIISGLLFFCLKKRKSRAPIWTEKRVAGPSITEKLKSVPRRLRIYFARIKEGKAGPMNSSYQRHTAQASVSSVYSTSLNGRGRSTSEPQGMFAVQSAGSVRSTSSIKSGRNLLRKKPSSISSNYHFPNTMESSSSQNNKADHNPFADPIPQRNLQLLNSDPKSGFIIPLPAVTSSRLSRDPFASLLAQIEDAPDWLKDPSPTPGYGRIQSSASALPFHPASSVRLQDNNPFTDSSNAPAVPTQAVFPHQKRRSSFAYPAFNATSTIASRDSQSTFFGEPGPSRPETSLFTPEFSTGRTGRAFRQSDPFDLDRPEVLGFGNVLGRKEVHASVTRQATQNQRTSSVGNWANVADGLHGPYERDSAKPGPLWSADGRR